MEASTTKFSELPKHEIMRASGQVLVHLGGFLLAVSSVVKYLGAEGDVSFTPSGPGVNSSPSNNSQTKRSGYFDN